MIIGVIGSGAMGAGIAQVFLQNGHGVALHDAQVGAALKAKDSIFFKLDALLQKQKISAADATIFKANLHISDTLSQLANCDLVIEAIVEDLEIKKSVFKQLDALLPAHVLIASNTSSLSITQLAAVCQHPHRFIGIHFFNPAPLMALVEIIPGVRTSSETVQKATALIQSCGKTTVLAKDTPGFIVNRVARTFYSEAIHLYETGVADMATIDAAMVQLGGFRMGPFALMDFIGHDINFRVTEIVWRDTYFEPKYKPSLSQKALFNAGFWGKKTGRGWFDYAPTATLSEPNSDPNLQQAIFDRIIAMLVNDAYDVLNLGIATPHDIETAMTKGVNYPKGLLAWGQEIGLNSIKARLDTLFNLYHNPRYSCSPGLIAAFQTQPT